MKKQLLFCLAAFTLVFGFTNANAAAITWTGGASSTLWSATGNWSTGTVPTSTDDVTIPSTTFKPTVNVTANCKSLTISGSTVLTLSANLTIAGSFSINSGFSLNIPAGTNQTLTVGGSATLSAAGSSLIIGASNKIVLTSLTISSGCSLSSSGTITASSDVTLAAAGSSLNNTTTGSFTTGGKLHVSSGCTVSNAGSFTVSTGTTTLDASGAVITNASTGTFKTSSDVSLGSGCTITNSGSFDSSNGDYTFAATGSAISNLSGGTYSIYNNSSITLSAGCFITNAGTFNAGKSNLSCKVSLDANSSEYISNTGTFFLGSTSAISLTGSSTYVKNTGTFTLQSDINGSAAISATFTPTATTGFIGTFNVERYLSGSTTSNAYRGYRLLSSPVATSTASGIYSINYLQTSTWLSGPVGGGFDYPNPGNPTIYLYRDNLKPSNLTFTSGNFRGVIAINVGSSLYSIVGDGNRAIYTGNGFLFYDRGSRTNQTTKFTPGAIADPTTLTAIGTLNIGTIAVRLWFTASGLDYTSVTGNSAILGFALIGNPYASSINWDTSTSGGITSTNVGLFTYTLVAATNNYNVYKANTASGHGTIIASGSNIIPSGQGFFVKATGASPTLSFTEAAKTTSQATAALGNSLLGTPVQAAVTPLLHLMLSQDTINKDGILILFDKNAKMQYDSTEDARYLKGEGTVSLSALSSDSVRLAINSTPLPKLAPEVIPLAVNASANGRYQLNMDAVESLPDLFQVWLMDAYKKDSLDIKHNPLYTFDISGADVGSFGVKRFSLVIRQDPALGVHLLNFTATKVTTGSQVVWATENEQNYTNFTVERSTDGITFQVLDGVSSSAQGTYSFLDKSPAEGTDQYRLKIVDLNGTVSYSKIVTLMYGNTSAIAKTGIEIYPNPAKGPLNLAINPVLGAAASNSTNSVYSIKIVSSTGAIVQNTTTNSANWQTDVSGLVPGTYVVQVSTNNSLIGHGTFIKL